jgi:2,4-dienoyl-CoA reductase-like NADH-dependent reductase (Old Yellow Enzyme family)
MPSALFSPYKINQLELANRIVVAPMCQYSADDGVPSPWHITHLGMLANSGASLVVVEATGVERIGRITHGCTGIYSDSAEDEFARVIAHCKRIGTAKFGIQLGHAGRKASSARPWEGGLGLKPEQDPWPTIGPSAIAPGAAWAAPRAMDEADMNRVRDAFVESAKRSLRAGFEEIELHMAHGYLLHSFVSPISNKRNDAYGGSLEGRMKFPLEVLRAVRAVLPKGFPLGARISATDWMDGGLTGDDSVLWVKAMKEAGLDFVCISSGGVTAEVRTPTTPGYNVPLAEQIKRETGIATRAVGLIATPKQAEEIVASGKADMIALGRAMLDEPHWAWRAAHELGAEVARPNQYLRTSARMWPGAGYRSNAA